MSDDLDDWFADNRTAFDEMIADFERQKAEEEAEFFRLLGEAKAEAWREGWIARDADGHPEVGEVRSPYDGGRP